MITNFNFVTKGSPGSGKSMLSQVMVGNALAQDPQVFIIDLGITRIKSKNTKSGWKLLGDVAFEECKDKCSFITPVPGGVGPMTIAMLLKNTLKSAKNSVY